MASAIVLRMLDVDAVIRARIDQDTKSLLERAARTEACRLSAWMRLHLIRIAEEILARRRRVEKTLAKRLSQAKGSAQNGVVYGLSPSLRPWFDETIATHRPDIEMPKGDNANEWQSASWRRHQKIAQR
jgi:hypothetical protein